MKRRIVLFAAVVLAAACSQNPTLEIQEDGYKIVLTAIDKSAIRVQAIPDTPVNDLELEELIYTEPAERTPARITKDDHRQSISTAMITATYDKDTRTLSFTDADGKVLLREAAGGRQLTPASTGGIPSLNVRQEFESPQDEFLYGTGQFQDGYLNIRGLSRRLTQVNTQISIPFILSSKGYGLLWNQYGLTEYNPSDRLVALEAVGEDGQTVVVNATGTSGNVRERRRSRDFRCTIDIPESGDYSLLLNVGQAMARRHYMAVDGKPVIDVTNTWLPPTSSIIMHLDAGEHMIDVQGSFGDKPSVGWRKVTDRSIFASEAAIALDYTVFAGGADEVIGSYRRLTGHVPAVPDWAFGYIHCRERYDTQTELLENATRFHDSGIPVSVIVQDWQWWGKYGWNAMVFDEDKYPDPKAMTDRLHAMDMRLMISVWSKVDRNSVLGKQLAADNCYIEGTDWIDFFNPQTAERYWQHFRDSLALPYGIDAWWFDATEPENDDLAGRMVAAGSIPGEFYRNVYPLIVNRTMYNGFQSIGANPMVLTRSAFAGAQKYGIATWSGDVGNDWETLRRQIAGGLGQMACGLPWWTFDAGGFFRPGDQYTDPDYQERMIRWIEAAAFLPLMRVHGYMSRTEPWNYSEETARIFEKYIRLREEMLPYILEGARRVSEEDWTLMRPLIFDFPDDTEALSQKCEFMFGSDYLVAPVTEPGARTWRVYLPKNAGGWTYKWTNESYPGGTWVTVPAELDIIPVFIRG